MLLEGCSLTYETYDDLHLLSTNQVLSIDRILQRLRIDRILSNASAQRSNYSRIANDEKNTTHHVVLWHLSL